MYIQPYQNNINMHGREKDPNFWRCLKQKVLDKLPNATFNDSYRNVRRWKNFDERISRPAEYRLIMGATAMLSQPAIDYYNHKVDEETREVSKNRTIAKIIAGTLVGIMVRGSAYELVQKMTDIKTKSKYSRALLPTKHLRELLKDEKLLKNYRSALATSIAIMAMCITNFAIDAPLTVVLTNYFNQNRKDKYTASVNGGANNG